MRHHPESESPGADNGTAGPIAPAKAKTSALRTAAVLLARYQIHSLRRVFEEFDRDILLPILLGEIALHNIGALEHGTDDLQLDTRDVICDADEEAVARMRPCNAYSIAAATGLPRETVRRKIGRLVELGWIRRQDNGHLYLSARALKHFGVLLCSRDLPEFLQTAERVRKLNPG
jgi:CRP-like cAMP-binding protein